MSSSLWGTAMFCEICKEHQATVHFKQICNGEVKEMVIDTIPGNWKAYYQNISDVLNKGAELAVKPEEVRENMRVIDAIMESAEKGVSVKME